MALLDVAEAILIDRARDDDRAAVAYGRVPEAEAELRAVLDPSPSVVAAEEPGPEPATASITDLYEWVQRANRLIGKPG